MKWSAEQDTALLKVSEWFFNSDKQVFRLFGYAGTGKTTLAQEIVSNVSGTVFFAAFTGKAAHVLKQKGCPGACTIHSLIYHPREKDRQTLAELMRELEVLRQDVAAGKAKIELYERKQAEIEAEKNSIARPAFQLNTDSELRFADLLIVDECSMIDDEIGKDLLSFGVKILVLGDPAQLPPVKGSGFFIQEDPDFMLTDIHRQAAESPIIRLATDVRNGKRLVIGQYGSCSVIAKASCTPQLVTQADQIIVGKNDTRRGYNQRLRTLLGFTQALPQPKDKLVCLQNTKEYGLLNGQIWYVDDREVLTDAALKLTIHMPDEEPIIVEAHAPPFLGQEVPWFEKKDFAEFDYGYALTCHKSQGSQWDNVVVFDESFCFKANQAKWLYTAITRAAEKLTIVKM